MKITACHQLCKIWCKMVHYFTRFSVDHAMICHKGGIPTLHHNEVCDLTVELLAETASGVSIEPRLQPLHDEVFQLRSANREDEVRLNVRASNFWCKDRRPFLTLGFSTRSPPPTAKRNSSLSIECTNWKRNGSMLRGYEKLSVEPSPPWFLHLLEVWPESAPSVSRELLTSCSTGKRCHSHKSSIWSDATFHLPYFVRQSGPTGAHDSREGQQVTVGWTSTVPTQKAIWDPEHVILHKFSHKNICYHSVFITTIFNIHSV